MLPSSPVSDEAVSKTWSATGHGLVQQPLDSSRMLIAVGWQLGDLDREPFCRFVFQRCADESDEERMRAGGAVLQPGMRLGADEELVPVSPIFDELDKLT